MRRRLGTAAIVVLLLALAGLIWWALGDGSAPAPVEPSKPDTVAATEGPDEPDVGGEGRRRVRVPRKDAGDEPVAGDETVEDPETVAEEPPPPEDFPEGPAAIGELVGRVLMFPDRSPVSGAVVRLRWGTPGRDEVPYPEPDRVTTGPNGVFRMASFAPGTYSIDVMLEGRAPRQLSIAIPTAEPPDELEVLFGVGGHVAGTVQTADGPAVGLTVRINPSGIGGGKGLLSCDTDAAGGYRFDDVPPGAYGVEVDGKGAFAGRNASVTVIAGETARVDFKSLASLVGSVRWDGAPLAKAIVRVRRAGPEFRSEQSQSAEDGSYQVDGLEPGEHVVTVQVLDAPGFAVDAAETTLTVGENRLDLLLGQGDIAASIEGRLTVAAPGVSLPPRAQITISAMRQSAEDAWEPAGQAAMAFPGENGAFRVLGLPAGRYQVMVYPRGGNLKTVRVELTLSPGERKKGLEIPLEPREPQEAAPETPSVSVLSGVVTDGGLPVAGAFVHATLNAAESRRRQTRTDGTGRYLLERLEPGTWSLHVQLVGKGGFSVEVAQAEIVEGKNRRDVALGEGELAGEIRGRVFARVTGQALTSKDVVLWLSARDGDERGRHMGMTSPDAEGKFRFRCVRGGAYRILATPRGGSLRAREVDVDVVTGRALERVEVALEEMRTGMVRFVLRTEDGSLVRQARIVSMLDGELRQGSKTANSGSGVYETHFEAGTHEITLSDWTNTVRAEVSVDVLEGETVEVKAVLRPVDE